MTTTVLIVDDDPVPFRAACCATTVKSPLTPTDGSRPAGHPAARHVLCRDSCRPLAGARCRTRNEARAARPAAPATEESR
jgi:hypothetical protein